MHRYHLIEIGQRIFFNGNNRPVVTCVVHQNSYRTKFFTRRVDDPPAVVFDGDVRGCECDWSAGIRNLRRCGSKLIMRTRTQKNWSAFFCKEQCKGAANTAA